MELKDYLAPLQRWWQLIVAATLVAAITSFIAVRGQPATYRSSVTIMIGAAFSDPNPNYYQFYSSQQLAATYADIALRRTVKEGAMQALELSWLPAYTVQPVSNTQLLEIAVVDTDPRRAQAVANELARQLILQSPTSSAEMSSREGFIQERLDTLEAQITETQSEIDARQTELGNLTSARQISDVQNQIAALQSKLDNLQYNYSTLVANTQRGALNSLSVIEAANLPTTPIGPNRPLQVITASALAFLLAVAAAYLLAFMDSTVKSPEDVKRITGSSILGVIPEINGATSQEKIAAIHDPRSPASEAFRSLRTGVQFTTVDQEENTAIQVTSANPSEGKSLISANLAVVMAQQGLQVLLVDADLRKPKLHRLFGLDNRMGLSDLFRSRRLPESESELDEMLGEVIRPTNVEGLSILTSGPIPPNPSELLGSNTHRQLVAALKKRYEYLIVDSPPVLVVTDAVVVSTLVNGSIIVFDSKATHRNQLKQAAERLKEVNARILGVVANQVSARSEGFASYGQYAQYRQYGEYGLTNPQKPGPSFSNLVTQVKNRLVQRKHQQQ